MLSASFPFSGVRNCAIGKQTNGWLGKTICGKAMARADLSTKVKAKINESEDAEICVSRGERKSQQEQRQCSPLTLASLTRTINPLLGFAHHPRFLGKGMRRIAVIVAAEFPLLPPRKKEAPETAALVIFLSLTPSCLLVFL